MTSLPLGVLWAGLLVPSLVVSVVLIPVGGLGLLLLYGVLRLASLVAGTERARAEVLLGRPVTRPLYEGTRVMSTLRDSRRWNEVGYLILLLPLGVLGYVVSTFSLGAGVALLLSPAYVGTLPAGRLRLPLGGEVDGPLELALTSVAGLLLLAAATHLIHGVTALHARLVQALLAEDEQARLTSRVAELTETRAAIVEATDAERRRIERDLHDGVQQRLVALAMDLGMARHRTVTDPAAAAAVLASAHGEVKAVLADLRALVRGLHPVVLADRGLDAALSALAARSPVPVHLDCVLRGAARGGSRRWPTSSPPSA